MSYPDFFDKAPRITMQDPLAAFLGAAEDGIMEYGYADAVKLAGHSCPTVASTYLMARSAFATLYPGELPKRGDIQVDLPDERQDGVAGVVANVLSLLTGATQDTGFKGIGGRFDRRNLLSFGVPVSGQIRFTRLDTEDSVTVSARLNRVPGDPRVAGLMPRCISNTATDYEATLFQTLWQERVRKLLIEHADDPDVIVVQH
ncbi:MAG TPA: hypothetical protein VIR04_06860 [Paralcaligenes sp.]|jgi:hypothetical protein